MEPDGQSDPVLLCDPADKESLENRNADDQLEYINYLVTLGATELRESHILELHKLCVRDIYPCGGTYRALINKVYIANSQHEIPEAASVPALVHEAIDWINDSRRKRSALERAAYSMWRVNWIHPFCGGNGRTSRAIAYLLVCIENGAMLPGDKAMPSLIIPRRDDYLTALRAVDESARKSDEPDFAAMSSFLQEILTRQLASAIDKLSSCGPAD